MKKSLRLIWLLPVFFSSLLAQQPTVTGNPIGDLAMHPQLNGPLPKGDDDDLQLQDIGGRKAWVATSHDAAHPDVSSAYFMADNSLRNLPAGHKVNVELIYFDQAAGQYTLSYDAQDTPPAAANAKSTGKPLPALATTGSNQWKSVRWTIPDPRFAGNLSGADLKLESNGPLPLTVLGIYINSVYGLSDDSRSQPDVPHGEVIKFQFDQSKIYPGTTREVSIYIPKQYDASKPACVWVSEDGMMWNAPAVLDNLIARKEVPVMIAIGVTPGLTKFPQGNPGPDHNNRQYEYDVMDDSYVRFLLEEIYPSVEAKKTADGRAIKLSRDGNDCGITGASSGGICSFNAAWQRPDAFTRVFSAIGSFDDLQGGDRFPDYVRKTEPKPIRVFVQDGDHDLNWFGGDWFKANERMSRALTWAGYENDHAWGDHGHDGDQASRIFPDVLRYLWKDWPAPVKIGETTNPSFRNTFVNDSKWEQVWEGSQTPSSLAVNAQGEVFFNDPADGKEYKLDASGKVGPAFDKASGDAGAVFGSDGRLYQVDKANRQIVAYDAQGKQSVIVKDISGEGIVALPHNRFFVTEPGTEGAESHIRLIGADGSKKIVDTDAYAFGALGVDQACDTLEIGDAASPWISVASVLPDGTLANRQRYLELEAPVTEPATSAKGICLWPNVQGLGATSLGVQIYSGVWVQGISPVPGGPVTSLVLGGKAFDQLYVVSGHKIYLRKTKLHGFPPPPL